MAAALRMVGDKLALKVAMLDNSHRTLLVDPEATVQAVCDEMAARVGFADVGKVTPHFALHECLDGVTISRPLSPKALIKELAAKWPAGDAPRLVYQVKLFMESLKRSGDPKIQYMLYIQAVYNVITGIYPTADDDAISLASLQVQAKFGNHKPDVHKPPYLQQQLRGLVPAALLQRRAPADVETLILGRHAILNADAQGRPQQLYCAFLAPRDYYGCAFFTVKQRFSGVMPPILTIAASANGVLLLHRETKATLERYALNRIFRWGYKPGETFYFQIKTAAGGKGPLFEFETINGMALSDLLNDYAHQILAELGGVPPGAAAAAAPAPAPAAPASPAAPVSSPGAAEGMPFGAFAVPTPVDAAAVAAAPCVPPLPQRASKQVHRLPPDVAATRVQAAFRGYRVRTHLKRHYAAVRIQARYRGYRARVAFDKMLDEAEAALRAM